MNMVIPFIGLVGGIALSYLGCTYRYGIIAIISGLVLYYILLKLNKKISFAYRYNFLHFIWIGCLFIGIGIFDANIHKTEAFKESQLNNITAYSGTIDKIEYKASGERFILKTNKLYLSNGETQKIKPVKILIFSDGIQLVEGDIIKIDSKPTIIDNIDNKYNHPSLEPVLYHDKISENNVTILNSSKNIYYYALKLRDKIEIKIEKSSLKRETAEFIISILLGDKSYLDSNIRQNFSFSGISHILALSGMHVAILTSFLLVLLFPLKVIGFRKTAYIIAIIFIWFYTLLTGLSPSTMRAALMTTFLLIALFLQRPKSSWTALLCATFIILLFDPDALFNIGLQFSFICVASLIMFVRPLNPIDLKRHPLLHKIISGVLVTLVATFSTWVLTSFYFSKVPLLFLPANLIILPLLPFYMGVALIYTLFLLIGIDLNFVSYLLDKGYLFFFKLTEITASFKGAWIRIHVDMTTVLLWLSGILLLGIIINKKLKKIYYSIPLSFFIISVLFIPKDTDSHSLSVRKDYYAVNICIEKDGEILEKNLPRYTISNLKYKNYNIYLIDQKLEGREINKIIRKEDNEILCLIIGGGALDISLSEDIDKIFDNIIIHSSVRKKKERELIETAKELGLNIHSLRDEGTFSVTF